VLSFVVTLINQYERDHGVRPNLLYMNEAHYLYLREELPGISDHEDVTAIVGTDIALSDTALSPYVSNVRYGATHVLSS
jgi:hypothetical protein